MKIETFGRAFAREEHEHYVFNRMMHVQLRLMPPVWAWALVTRAVDAAFDGYAGRKGERWVGPRMRHAMEIWVRMVREHDK